MNGDSVVVESGESHRAELEKETEQGTSTRGANESKNVEPLPPIANTARKGRDTVLVYAKVRHENCKRVTVF